jgi:hypothetical protein
MTMMSPGRAISPEGERPDGAPERPDALWDIFDAVSFLVTFFDVLVLTVALLEAGLLTAVFLAVVFPVLVLLAVFLFVGTVRLPYHSGFLHPTSSTSRRPTESVLDARGMAQGRLFANREDRVVLKGPSPCADLREDGGSHEAGGIGRR